MFDSEGLTVFIGLTQTVVWPEECCLCPIYIQETLHLRTLDLGYLYSSCPERSGDRRGVLCCVWKSLDTIVTVMCSNVF